MIKNDSFVAMRYLAVFGALLLTGCAASSPMLYTKQNPASQERVIGVMGNRLTGRTLANGKPMRIYFSPQRIVQKDGAERFQFVIQVTSPEGPYVLIRPGRSLLLDIDGRQTAYATKQGSGPRRTKIKKFLTTTYSESAVYEGISENDIARISQAKQVTVTIDGKSNRIVCEFSEQNFAAFEALLEHTPRSVGSTSPSAENTRVSVALAQSIDQPID